MHCIVCGDNLNQSYYIGKKSDMGIFLCSNHKFFCTNDCELIKIDTETIN
ncbi:MAG: hypothetical protein QXM68_00495 [Candidatus Aenigmatarchaeota archaeon]|nr:hypothetical protein [Candidatus Aenigmarchaeota archaeon]